jgi:hypothetical protein
MPGLRLLVIYASLTLHIMSFNNNGSGPVTFGTYNAVAGNQDNSRRTHNENSKKFGNIGNITQSELLYV